MLTKLKRDKVPVIPFLSLSIEGGTRRQEGKRGAWARCEEQKAPREYLGAGKGAGRRGSGPAIRAEGVGARVLRVDGHHPPSSPSPALLRQPPKETTGSTPMESLTRKALGRARGRGKGDAVSRSRSRRPAAQLPHRHCRCPPRHSRLRRNLHHRRSSPRSTLGEFQDLRRP